MRRRKRRSSNNNNNKNKKKQRDEEVINERDVSMYVWLLELGGTERNGRTVDENKRETKQSSVWVC